MTLVEVEKQHIEEVEKKVASQAERVSQAT